MPLSINLLADENIYRLKEFLPSSINLHTFDPADGPPVLYRYQQALFIRTVTPVSAERMPDIPASLKFIGTASAGTDHIDEFYLEEQGITFAHTRGCNANAVGEYIITTLLYWCHKKNQDPETLKVGVVGAGHTGSAVLRFLKVFGITCKIYDPPRQQRDNNFISASLDEVLSCDVLTFHVPLTHTGNHPTYHWLDKKKLKDGKKFKLIINAARGGVIDEKALLKASKKGIVENFILDVWEDEPDFNTDIADRAFIATPHIAGYSEQAKLKATDKLVEQCCRHFGLNYQRPAEFFSNKTISLDNTKKTLPEILLKLHPVAEYDNALRKLIDKKDKAMLFAKLRTGHPLRFEYPNIELSGYPEEMKNLLQKLGIQLT